jgi:hypothetical protein
VKWRGAIVAVLAFPAAASAEDVYIVPEIPDEITKSEALKLAYEINGFSMVRHPGDGMIDLSQPKHPWPKSDSLVAKTVPKTKSKL